MVTSAVTGSKFYQLLPEQENTVYTCGVSLPPYVFCEQLVSEDKPRKLLLRERDIV